MKVSYLRYLYSRGGYYGVVVRRTIFAKTPVPSHTKYNERVDTRNRASEAGIHAIIGSDKLDANFRNDISKIKYARINVVVASTTIYSSYNVYILYV